MRISFVKQVADHLFMVKGEGNAFFPFCHTYLYDGEVFIVFDPQCGRLRLRRALKKLGKDYSSIDFVYNTHFHLDHTGSNAFLKKKSNAQILIHEADLSALESLDEYVKRYGMTDKKLEQEWSETLKVLGYREKTIDRTFIDGQVLPGDFQVVHTPGHAPGHCCFYKSEILISGDIDLAAPWVGNLTSSVGDYLRSLDKLKILEIKLLLPGHRQIITENIPERLESFRQRFIKRGHKILNVMPSEPITLSQLTEKLFQTFSEAQRQQVQQTQVQFSFHFGKISTLNYLIHLETLGKVQRIEQDGQERWQKIN